MQAPIYGYSRMHSTSSSAFRNTCEYACALDVQTKRFGYGKNLQYIFCVAIVAVGYIFYKGLV